MQQAGDDDLVRSDVLKTILLQPWFVEQHSEGLKVDFDPYYSVVRSTLACLPIAGLIRSHLLPNSARAVRPALASGVVASCTRAARRYRWHGFRYRLLR